MPYATGRIVHDADAHLMETPTWLRDHAEAAYRDRLPVLRYQSGNELRQTGSPEDQQRDLVASFDRLAERHASQEYRATEEAEIMARKNFAATGSFIAEDRPRALDLLGFSSQLIFNTFHNGRLFGLEHAGDNDLAFAAARAHNRGMLEFCAVDSRLLPSLYVPLVDPARAIAATTDAIDQGAAALLIASGCPPGHSPSHTDLFGVWARAEEAGIPVVFHVGGTGDLIDPNYFANRRPRRWPPSSSTGCWSASPPCASGSLSRAPSGCPLGCARWSPPSRPSTATRSASNTSRSGRRTTCTGRSASPPTRRRTSAG